MTVSLTHSTDQQTKDFADVISKLAERFVTLTVDQLDPGIEEVLALIGQSTGAHRSTIFEFSATQTQISNTYEWCAPGVPSQKSASQHLPVTAFPWIMTQHERGEVIYIPDVAALPAIAASEKRAFQRDGVKSLITVPLALGDKAIGFFGLSSLQAQPGWSLEILALLRQAGEILASALQRRASATRLHEREDRYRILVETSPDGIFIYQGKRITFGNSAGLRLLGMADLAELVGKSPLDLLHPEDHSTFLELHQQVIHTTHVLPYYTARLIRPDGRVIDIEMGASAFVDQGEQTILLIMRDISERKRLEEQRVQAAKMEAIARLTGGIAHDFNNLLTAIMGYHALSMDGLLPGEPRYEYATEMNKAIERAVAFTRQLLAFSRRQNSQPQPFDVNIVIRRLLVGLRPLLGDMIQIFTDLAPDAGVVLLGPGQLDQVIINLAVHARDAMPHGGELTLATRSIRSGGKVRLTVTDTGLGMDEATRLRIFEPFFTTKTLKQGTGLGLATIYALVKQNGGEISVTSAPGQGTTFTLEWPRSLPMGNPGPAAILPSIEARPSAATLLVVEDDELVLTYLQTMLSGQGYQVFTATTGAVALAFQRQYRHPIDLIVTDLLLPGVDGQALVEEMRRERPEIAALFISGYADEVLQRQQIDLAGALLLRKPFSHRELLQAVQALLAAAPKQLEYSGK